MWRRIRDLERRPGPCALPAARRRPASAVARSAGGGGPTTESGGGGGGGYRRYSFGSSCGCSACAWDAYAAADDDDEKDDEEEDAVEEGEEDATQGADAAWQRELARLRRPEVWPPPVLPPPPPPSRFRGGRAAPLLPSARARLAKEWLLGEALARGVFARRDLEALFAAAVAGAPLGERDTLRRVVEELRATLRLA